MLRGDNRHLRRQDVPEHPGLVFETKQIPAIRLQQETVRLPLQGPLPAGRIGEHSRARAISEQAGTDEHPRIVIEIKSCAAHFHADGQYALAAFGSQQSFAPGVNSKAWPRFSNARWRVAMPLLPFRTFLRMARERGRSW